MTERIYRDVHPDLYRELVDHAEHRGLTVNAFLEDLAIAYTQTHNPDGTRRDVALRIPRGWQAIPDPVPVVTRSGRARTPRNSNARRGVRRHFLDDPQHEAEFLALAEAGQTNAQIGAHFGKAAQTISNWRERLGIPASTATGGRTLASTA